MSCLRCVESGLSASKVAIIALPDSFCHAHHAMLAIGVGA